MSKRQFSPEQKLKIVKSGEKVGIREAARIAGVHFTSVYDWRNAIDTMGEEAFLAYKPAIPGRGVKEITVEQEQAVVKCREGNPGFGPGQVRNQLRRQGITISIRTVRKIMEADGYRAPERKADKVKSQRFEAERPLALSQMDILEFFINKLKVFIILLLDDFSRFILGWSLLEECSVDAVIELVERAINRYGKMEEVLTDRGFVFYSWRGINRFERFLELHRIDHTHARPHHPQTLGKVEACNKRIKRELIDRVHFANAHEANLAMEEWVEHYNYERSHQGIGGLLTPAERFHGRSRQVLSEVAKGVDVTGKSCYHPFDIERSILNLLVTPDGKLTLHILGQPIVLKGGADAAKTKS